MSSKSTETTSNSTEDRYSLLFPIYDEADLVVRSSDGILFATRKVFLQAASSVLDDVLATGLEKLSEKWDGRAMLQLSEKGEELEPFLRLVQRDRFAVDGKELEVTLPMLVSLSRIVDKYEASNLSSILFGGCLHRLLCPPLLASNASSSDGMSLLALAIIHRELVAARAILRRFSSWYIPETRRFYLLSESVEADFESTQPRRELEACHFAIKDIPDELLARIPVRTIESLNRLVRRVLDDKHCTWLNAADDFEL